MISSSLFTFEGEFGTGFYNNYQCSEHCIKPNSMNQGNLTSIPSLARLIGQQRPKWNSILAFANNDHECMKYI